MNLQFKFEVCKKNQGNKKKLMKYTKKSLNFPKFKQEVLNNVRKASEKIEQKNKKIKILLRVSFLALGEETLL